jgi:hypothetical protein
LLWGPRPQISGWRACPQSALGNCAILNFVLLDTNLAGRWRARRLSEKHRYHRTRVTMISAANCRFWNRAARHTPIRSPYQIPALKLQHFLRNSAGRLRVTIHVPDQLNPRLQHNPQNEVRYPCILPVTPFRRKTATSQRPRETRQMALFGVWAELAQGRGAAPPDVFRLECLRPCPPPAPCF